MLLKRRSYQQEIFLSTRVLSQKSSININENSYNKTRESLVRKKNKNKTKSLKRKSYLNDYSFLVSLIGDPLKH